MFVLEIMFDMNVFFKIFVFFKVNCCIVVFEGEYIYSFVNFFKVIYIVVFFCKNIYEINGFIVINFIRCVDFYENLDGQKIGYVIMLCV